jgi:ribosomal protein S18 acetylase RimI-like enzyme
MRQVAVSGEMQKLGLGRILVQKTEEFAKQRNFTEMVLNARISALGFYLKMGYEVIGLPIEEIRIPHQKMRKSL